MDYYNIDSEVTESLDCLSPPVKRIYRNVCREKYQPNNAYNQHNTLLRDFRTVTKQTTTQLPVFDRFADGPSSTSLVLKRTTEGEIFERYSVLSYTNLQYSNSNQTKKQATIQTSTAQDRPLINVTHSSNNSTEAPTTKLRKRRHVKEVQTTVSNLESSIKASKNVYLVVTGRKREKIYEIKTTGSAEFSNNQQHFQNEDNAIQKVTHFKQLINSLNMDKKKKQRKKELLKKDSRISLGNELLEGIDYRDCSCSNNVQNVAFKSPKDVRARKSRLRISGRIGLTEDDKYVLRYAATVDDHPLEADYSKVCPVIKCRNGRCRKDSNVQADFRRENTNKNQADVFLSKETQCTQSNFNTVVFSNIDKLEITSKRDEVTQCHCSQSTEDVTRYEYERDCSKDCSIPLVLISVYPKKDSEEKVNKDKSPIRSNTNRPTTQRTNVFNMNTNLRVRSVKPKKDKDIESKDVSLRTRSPSPSRSPMKSRLEYALTSQEKGITRKKMGQKETTTLHTDTVPTRKKYDNKEVISKPNIGTVRKHFETKETTTSTKKTNKTEQAKEKNLKNNAPQARPINKRQQNNVKTDKLSHHVTKGTNTEHILKKKALVDSYTRKLAAQMKQKKVINWTPPDNDVSNVTINIDGENEFYDVLFRQGDLTTDLRICKTVKEKASQKVYNNNEEDNSASLENFFLLADNGERRKKSFSQTYLLDEPSINNLALSKPMSRLNVRDSIEISHRRENRISVLSNSPQTNAAISNKHSNKDDSKILIAPVKHYRGDSCALPDPVKRDKEIRELLGIVSRRPNTLKPRIEEESISANEDHSLHCFYQTKCENQNSFDTEVPDSMCSIFKLLPPPCCCPDYGHAFAEKNKESDQSYSSKDSSSEEFDSSEKNIKDQKTQQTATKEQTVSKVKDSDESKPSDSDQTDSDESKQKDQKSSLKKPPLVSEPTYSDQSESDESKQNNLRSSLKQPSLVSEPTDSDLSESNESKQSHLKSSLKQPSPASEPTDSDQSESNESKQNYLRSSLKKVKDSDQTDSDQSKQIQKTKSNDSLQKRSKQKSKDSYETDTDQPNKIHRKSNIALKQETEPKPKESDDSDCHQSKNPCCSCRSEHSLKKRTKITPKGSDESHFDQSNKINRKSNNALKHETGPKLNDSDDSDYYQPKNICCGCRSEHSLKKRNKTTPNDSDESVSDQLIKKDHKSKHSIKHGTKRKPKDSDESDSDESDSDQPIEKGHISEYSLQYGTKRKPKDSDELDSDESYSDQPMKKDHKSKNSLSKSKYENQSDSDEQAKIDKKKRLINKEKYSKQKFKDSAEKHIISKNLNSDRSDSGQTHNSKERRYSVEQAPLYQQLILNRNINVYLQIEQFTKQKPIVLSRKQYDKVKKTIENASTKRTKMNYKCICTKSSPISLGEVRKKSNNSFARVDRTVQTKHGMKATQNVKCQCDVKQNTKPVKQSIESQTKEKLKEKRKEKPKERPDKAMEKNTQEAMENIKEKSKENSQKVKGTKYCPSCGEYQTKEPIICKHCRKPKHKCCEFCGMPLYFITTCNSGCYCSVDKNETLVLFDKKDTKSDKQVVNVTENPKMKSSKHSLSSLKIRYTSVAFMKHVTFSSTKIAENAPNPSVASIAKMKSYHSDSLHTIFKGYKKSPTPNLGTSAYSMYSEYSDAKSPDLEAPPDLKQRKTLLKRLMSCLVMRSKALEYKMGRPVPKMASVNSSIDSYHISTSLGAIELSSSIYDTSASFYSNHTIMPVTTKIKRGFLSSVRGFLTTTRRS